MDHAPLAQRRNAWGNPLVGVQSNNHSRPPVLPLSSFLAVQQAPSASSPLRSLDASTNILAPVRVEHHSTDSHNKRHGNWGVIDGYSALYFLVSMLCNSRLEREMVLPRHTKDDGLSLIPSPSQCTHAHALSSLGLEHGTIQSETTTETTSTARTPRTPRTRIGTNHVLFPTGRTGALRPVTLRTIVRREWGTMPPHARVSRYTSTGVAIVPTTNYA